MTVLDISLVATVSTTTAVFTISFLEYLRYRRVIKQIDDTYSQIKGEIDRLYLKHSREKRQHLSIVKKDSDV